MFSKTMILPIVLLLSIQAIYADEFPSLMKYIKVTWENVDITSVLDGSQTASVGGKVPSFTLCGKYNNTKTKNADCAFKYSYGYTSGGAYLSGSGNGTSSAAQYLSKTSDTDSCVSFVNFIPAFPTVYSQGNWKAEYNCKLVTPFPTGIVVGILIGALLIAGGIFGYKYLQKKKNAQTATGGGYMTTP